MLITIHSQSAPTLGEWMLDAVEDLLSTVFFPLATRITPRVARTAVDPDLEGGDLASGKVTVWRERPPRKSTPPGGDPNLQPKRTYGSTLLHTKFPQVKQHTIPRPDLDGTTNGVNEKAKAVEGIARLLDFGKCAQEDLEAKLKHRGAVRMVDTYPLVSSSRRVLVFPTELPPVPGSRSRVANA